MCYCLPLYVSCQRIVALLLLFSSNLVLGVVLNICVKITWGSLCRETPAMSFRKVFKGKRQPVPDALGEQAVFIWAVLSRTWCGVMAVRGLNASYSGRMGCVSKCRRLFLGKVVGHTWVSKSQLTKALPYPSLSFTWLASRVCFLKHSLAMPLPSPHIVIFWVPAGISRTVERIDIKTWPCSLEISLVWKPHTNHIFRAD